MTTRLDISIGPVQGFVAQSRRTRDLWGSSYLLSFLAAHAMRGAWQAGGRIVQPVVDKDRLYRWISGHREGDPPQTGTVPNHFVVEVDGGARSIAEAGIDGLESAWHQVCDAVWRRFIERACPAGDGTDRIWSRQIQGFWEITWAAGPRDAGGTPLARRKHWRSHRPPDEPGDKCTVMHDMQEISGYVRAESRDSRENQDRFWRRVKERLGPLDLRDNERLCSIALVKRLFPKVATDALGWNVDTSHWPSTVYIAAVPWIRRSVSESPVEAREYARAVSQYAGPGVLAEQRPPFPELSDPAAGDFPKIDANYFHCDWVMNERLCPLIDVAPDGSRAELGRLLKSVHEAKDQAGNPLGPPSLYYALLLADGDRLGKLLGEVGGRQVSQALATFTGNVPSVVRGHDGVTIYAGGDDVLAMLPVPKALSCAASLSRGYQEAFASRLGAAGRRASLSAAVVFAQARLPLRTVLASAHRLLDKVAKDGNGRNSLATGVLKPGGLNCQWVSTWTRIDAGGAQTSAVELLTQLVGTLKTNVAAPGLSSALIYRLREMLASVCGWDRWVPGAWNSLPEGLDLDSLLRAQVLSSLTSRVDEAVEVRTNEVASLVRKLLTRSPTPGSDDNAKTCRADDIGVDALLLARFLADAGREEVNR